MKSVRRESSTLFTASILVLALLLSAGCQTGGAGASDKVPQAAIDACLHNADAYQNAAPGTAKFSGNARADVAADNPAAAGSNWRLEVVVAGVAMNCVVSPSGVVQSLKPF
jgi:hypothetical protein